MSTPATGMDRSIGLAAAAAHSKARPLVALAASKPRPKKAPGLLKGQQKLQVVRKVHYKSVEIEGVTFASRYLAGYLASWGHRPTCLPCPLCSRQQRLCAPGRGGPG